MKRITALVLVIVLAFTITACRRANELNYENTVNASYESTTEATTTTTEPTTEQAVKISDVQWTDKEVVTSIDGGYTIRQKLHISEWINEDDEETLDAVWSEVSDKDRPSPPGFANGRINSNGANEYNEIYTAVGYWDTENETEGFDITSNMSVWVSLPLSVYDYKTNIGLQFSNSFSIGRTNYSDRWNGFWSAGNNLIHMNMNSNHCRVPFIISTGIERTPDYPEGKIPVNEVKFECGYGNREEFCLPVYDG